MESAAFKESVLTVTIVGTGRMAIGIAAAVAAVGHQVTVAGRREEAAGEVAALVAAKTGVAVVHGAIESETLASADVIIETIAEIEGEKLAVLERISGLAPDSALLATNTSSFSPSSLAVAVDNPGRFIGIHFLNPADQSLVVEVVGGELSRTEAIDAGCNFIESLGKRPIRVERDVKGYIWNRLQFAMFRECLHLLESGVADAADIDLAVSAGLAPRWMAAGPLATADLGGLQTFALISEQLFPVLATGAEVSELLRICAAEGGSLRRWDKAQIAQAIERRTKAVGFAAQMQQGSP